MELVWPRYLGGESLKYSISSGQSQLYLLTIITGVGCWEFS
jgi:hypothetical protein